MVTQANITQGQRELKQQKWQWRKQENKKALSNKQTNKNCENIANFLPDLFAIITQLTLSNLIAMAMQLSV